MIGALAVALIVTAMKRTERRALETASGIVRGGRDGEVQGGGTLPEGVVAQPNILTPIGYTRNYSRGTPEGDALTNPYPVDAAFTATG